jgi:hypothetical protein
MAEDGRQESQAMQAGNAANGEEGVLEQGLNPEYVQEDKARHQSQEREEGNGEGSDETKEEEQTFEWKSPISYSANALAPVLAEGLDELGYKYERDKSDKHYSKFMIIMPMPKFAYVYRFIVKEPSCFTIDAYDTQPKHAGVMPYIEITGITEGNAGDVKTVLAKLIEKLPRKPWKFTTGQRLMYGYLSLDFSKAKKQWKRIGLYSK